jgi:hypothetical protein
MCKAYIYFLKIKNIPAQTKKVQNKEVPIIYVLKLYFQKKVMFCSQKKQNV